MIKNKKLDRGIFCGLVALSLLFIYPLVLVTLNSFKNKLFILKNPFSIPLEETFAGIDNYIQGIVQSDFIRAFGMSLTITVLSVLGIVLLTSMAAWYIVRVKNRLTKTLYYLFVFSMIVPFQMVMYPMVYLVGQLSLNSPIGLAVVYIGFGAGLSIFMFSGFIKGIPITIEEAASIDGCGPLKTFFYVVVPILKPTIITVSILNAMWVWNDYLLPYLVLGTGENKTIPIAIQQAVVSAYGNVDWGAFMAMLVLAIIPIVAFYAACQKHIIKGVISGSVKG